MQFDLESQHKLNSYTNVSPSLCGFFFNFYMLICVLLKRSCIIPLHVALIISDIYAFPDLIFAALWIVLSFILI